MSNQRKLEQLIARVENHLECWKQFNHFIDVARSKKVTPEEEQQFLETKSIIVEELEIILAAMEVPSPTREEIHALVGSTPSVRLMSEMPEGALRQVESQWHKVYIGWHAILGQLKVRLNEEQSKPSFFASLFKRK